MDGTRVAAIDCGTNSIRLLVADLPDRPDEPLAEVTRQMEIVRLGQGVDRTGRLAPEAIERTRVALAHYADQIRALGARRVRMVATSASRDAENADEFRGMVRATLGSEPEVITGDEEARLSFAGAVRGMPAEAPPPYLVLDIGGGSTEFVVGSSTVDGAVSVDIGCVRMTERHFSADPPGPRSELASPAGPAQPAPPGRDQIAAAEADIAAAVDRALAAVPGHDGATLVGLAGSVTTVAAIALGLTAYEPARIHHARIPYDDVAKVTADLLALSSRQRLRIPVMHPGRADVIGAGALVLRIVMERASAPAVIASEHDILDGIALSLL